MKLEILETRTFPDAYSSLADKLEKNSIFFSSSWFNNLIANVIPSTDNTLWFGVKSASDQPLLLLPLVQTPQSQISYNKIRGLANYYTTLFEPLHTFEDSQELEIAIEQVINGVCRLKWDVIDLYPLNPASPSYSLIIKAFNKNKKHVTQYFMFGNWYLLSQGKCFAEYWDCRPSQLRNTIKRKTNKLKTKQIEYQIAQRPDEVVGAFPLYQQTYHASWKRDEPYTEFIPGLVQFAAKRNWLRLGLLFIDQEIAAAQLWLTIEKTAYIYKLCQNPKFDQYSPGSLLTIHLMRNAFEVDKVAKIDFLSGDDPYKKDWMSHREERWGLQIANMSSAWGVWQASKNSFNNFWKTFNLCHKKRN